MTAAKRPRPYYDKSLPACTGKWVSVHRGSAVVQLERHHTEHEARKAMGLKGGSKDPRYVP